jgi:hypothetical protein
MNRQTHVILLVAALAVGGLISLSATDLSPSDQQKKSLSKPAALETSHQQHTKDNSMSKPTYVQEYNAIAAVLNSYIEGCRQAKSSIMKPAFSGHATMFSVGADGKLAGGPIQGLFDGIDSGFRPSPEAQGVIVRIDIVGTAASARIDANDMSGYSFTDFFHLLKVAGKWTVVSKIFHTHVAP